MHIGSRSVLFGDWDEAFCAVYKRRNNLNAPFIFAVTMLKIYLALTNKSHDINEIQFPHHFFFIYIPPLQHRCYKCPVCGLFLP